MQISCLVLVRGGNILVFCVNTETYRYNYSSTVDY